MKALTEKEELKMNIKVLLQDEIRRELDEIKKIDVGTEECKVAIDGVTKLIGLSNDMDKVDCEYQDRYEAREIETELKKEQLNNERELKKRQLKDDRIDRHIKNVITVGTFVGGVLLTYWGTCKTFEFEKDGSITTIMGRGFINGLFHKK
jgi:adenylyl- and sulfurtransferase ThiI